MLGPLLFIIYINDIDNWAQLITIILKFADDTKSGNIMRNEIDRANLQQCVTGLETWVKDWGMVFNAKKCKVLHIGRNNPGHNYYMQGEEIQSVTSEKDIGVIISETLKPSDHCKTSAQTARAVLNQILRSFLYRDKNTFKKL